MQAVDWALREREPLPSNQNRMGTITGACCVFASYALAFDGMTKYPDKDEIYRLANCLLQDFSEMEVYILVNLEPVRVSSGYLPLFKDVIPRATRVIAESLSQLALRQRITLYSDTPTGCLATLLLTSCTEAIMNDHQGGNKHYRAAVRVLGRHESDYKVSNRAADSHHTFSKHPSSRRP